MIIVPVFTCRGAETHAKLDCICRIVGGRDIGRELECVLSEQNSLSLP